MPALRRFLAILLADLRERVRSPRFWTVLAIMAAITWLCFPAVGTGYQVLSLQGAERGFYSSAWIGMTLAGVFSLALSLCGFYLVRGTLVRDFDTKVWQLLVATPMTRGGFLLAKWLSHMLVFGLVVLVSLVVAVVAQWVRAEDQSLRLFELVKPVLVLTFPGLAVTSMLAIWFDLLPWLRRTAGNVIFYVLWMVALAVPLSQLEGREPSAAKTGWVSDPNGLVLMAREFERDRLHRSGEAGHFGFSVVSPVKPGSQKLFVWKSWSPRPMDLVGRVIWVGLALLGVLLAAPLLDWAAAKTTVRRASRSGAGARLRWLDGPLNAIARGRVMSLAAAELRLFLRQRRTWWWLALVAALALQAFGRGNNALQFGLLLAWLLPLDLLARGILREQENSTGELVFSAPGIVWKLLASRFVGAFLLLLVMTTPALLRLGAVAPAALAAGVVVCASIASWGIALSALCRNARPFELLLVLLAYASVQGSPIFDLSISPWHTLLWHGLLLLPCWLGLLWSWPRLASARTVR